MFIETTISFKFFLKPLVIYRKKSHKEYIERSSLRPYIGKSPLQDRQKMDFLRSQYLSFDRKRKNTLIYIIKIINLFKIHLLVKNIFYTISLNLYYDDLKMKSDRFTKNLLK